MNFRTRLLSLALLATMVAVDAAAAAPSANPDVVHARQQLAAVAVPFVPNAGQWDARVAYAAHTFAGTLFVTTGGQLVYSLPGPRSEARVHRRAIAASAMEKPAPAARELTTRGAGTVLTETLIERSGRRVKLAPRGVNEQPTRVSYFTGGARDTPPEGLATFEQLALGDAASGITLHLRATGSNVEKIFTVAPAADPRAIRVRLDGARAMAVRSGGHLMVRTRNGTIAYTAPVAYQEDAAGVRNAVPVRYALASSGKTYGFAVGTYDHTRPLVIDPLLQATYVGGTDNDSIRAVAVDVAGNVFVAGSTFSTNFPGTAGGARTASGGGQDAYVAKLNNTLTKLTQVTYLGGSGSDIAFALALDAAGNVFVAGSTDSRNFPGVAGGADDAYGGGFNDAFVAKLNNGLTTLIQATYLGGRGDESAASLAVDGSGNVFVAGTTGSTNFPGTANGAQPAYGGGFGDVFVARLNNGLTLLTQATYLGGSAEETDVAVPMVLDINGNVFVAGGTASPNFPGVSGGAQPAGGAVLNVFVARLNNDLTKLVQSTYLGGSSGTSQAYGVALDGSGSVFVAGATDSASFPGTLGGAQAAVVVGSSNAFVAKLNNSMTALLQSTYLGGDLVTRADAILVDATGSVYVAGPTSSNNLPSTAGGAQSGNHGGDGQGNDAYAAKFNNGLTAVIRATYLGGKGEEEATAIALDTTGNVFVAGNTLSGDFPGTNLGAQPTNSAGIGSGFVAKLTFDLAAGGGSPTATVFEFYNTTLKHYFRTAEAAEAVAIDGGAAGPGWIRTGLNFFANIAGAGFGNDVCRFYNPVANTHFFTADPAECAQVKLDSGWRYEGLAFRVQLPSASVCPQRTIPVYRNYNQRFAVNDSNHRFTTSQLVYNDMVAQGWVGEGVVMCALV